MIHIGWIGNILLSICGIPEAYLAYKRGHARGVSISFLAMWYLGEIFTFAYIASDVESVPLLVNYTVNIIAISIIIYYKIKERK